MQICKGEKEVNPLQSPPLGVRPSPGSPIQDKAAQRQRAHHTPQEGPRVGDHAQPQLKKHQAANPVRSTQCAHQHNTTHRVLSACACA
jgi:hypothetical protein